MFSRAGDRDAVEVLYRRHHDAAVRFARRLTGNAADADDVAHEAFTKVIAAIGSGNGPDAVFRPYLFRAVRTVAANHWEQQAKEIPCEETPDTALQDPGLEAVLSQDSITPAYRAFESLPPRWRTVLWHADVENEPPRRIAPLLGIEPNAVSALLMRARRGLREAFLNQYAAGELPQTGCQPTLPYLAGTVLGTASARDRSAAKQHAGDCEDCRKVIAELTDIRKTMRALIAPVLLLSPLLPSVSTGVLLRWLPRPRPSTGFIAAGSVIASITLTAGLTLFIQTTSAPTQPVLSTQEPARTSPQAAVNTSSSASSTPGSSPGLPTIDSSTAGTTTATDSGRTESLAVPSLPQRPASPLGTPSQGPRRNLPTASASHPAGFRPSPSATIVPSQIPSPARTAPSPTPNPAPATATPTPTPTSSSGTTPSPTATPGTPVPPPTICVPFLIWCLPV
ncbi:RNA polymerase sigma factor [Arthrobacter bambusae]|uniref:RNA polymerase sigma factor n=1 Tax=Arthrobacter bambusae TaxID=1338426 RepID=UPI0027D86C25|nr:sigma-70 family RNA polymerase sigma factor [Arthrobacter bambusae]